MKDPAALRPALVVLCEGKLREALAYAFQLEDARLIEKLREAASELIAAEDRQRQRRA